MQHRNDDDVVVSLDPLRPIESAVATATTVNPLVVVDEDDDDTNRLKGLDAQSLNDTMIYLDGPGIYSCSTCRTHLTSHDHIVSKSFHGRNGRAYLLDHCYNVTLGKVEERRLITGLHTVCDTYCLRCNSLVGWTYQKAYEQSQKYKEGKFIIEKIHLFLENHTDLYHNYYNTKTQTSIHTPIMKRDRFRDRTIHWGKENDEEEEEEEVDDVVTTTIEGTTCTNHNLNNNTNNNNNNINNLNHRKTRYDYDHSLLISRSRTRASSGMVVGRETDNNNNDDIQQHPDDVMIYEY